MTQKKSIRKRKDIAMLLAVLVIVVLINFVGAFLFKRFDLKLLKNDIHYQNHLENY